jgi:uncharacterized protein (TIGR02145 family)
MKKSILFISILVMTSIAASAQVKIGDNPTTIGASSLLELESTNKALLLPRLASTALVTAPVNGMIFYHEGQKCFKVYANGAWVNMTTCSSNTAVLTVASPTYQGVSVINSTGIGYNGEAVPAASTITVRLSNGATDENPYTLTATDATTGLTYTATGTIEGSASNLPVVLTHNAPTMPAFFSGVITMALTGASNSINLVPRIDIKSIPASATEVVDVTYGTQTWMDRNLGARRVATAKDDVYSFGNHYQWGRPADGHEISVWNGTTPTSGRGFADATALEALATSDTPGYPNFILTDVNPFDWRSDNNDNRWETVNQGPCPAGYHVPTSGQWTTADNFGSWGNNNATYNSALKLPSSGLRHRINGSLGGQGTVGQYWSSKVGGTLARLFTFGSSVAELGNNYRSFGFCVRCIKD